MTMIRVAEVEVGCRGQRITVRGTEQAMPGKTYQSEAETDMSLPQARELRRLLGRLIPVAEKSTVAAPVVALAVQEVS